MGEAARRRRAAAAGSRPGPAGRASAAGTDPREEAVAAMARLLRGNRPGRVSLAGAYALGYGALGMAQHDDDGPDWFHELDPLDTLFLGTAFPGEFHDEYEFGNARTAWLRQMRTTAHWRGIERFVAEVVQASQDHQMPVDEGELMLLVAGRLEAAGLDQRKLPATLLPGTALADADSEQLSDAPPRAEAWALGLAEDSPLVPAVDVLLLAADRGLDVDATLGHLFAVPAFTQPVPDGDRRFTSAPGGALTDVAFELGFRQVDTRDAKVLAMDADAKTMFQAQLRAFEDKFGRPPGPGDPVFFDPDADEPRPMPLAGMERASTDMLRAAGVCGAWIYACQHTGGLLPRPDGTFNTAADAAEWQEAVDRYLRTHPGETVDEAAELAKLRAMLAMISLDMAAGNPELGASLARQLHQAGPLTPGSDAEVVAEFLHAAADTITQRLGDPATVQTAAELARSWSGAAMARRVRDAATGDPDDVDLDILLAFAAARLAVP